VRPTTRHLVSRAALALASLGAVSGCTPDEVAGWWKWHDADPAAAERFLSRPDVQAELGLRPPVPTTGTVWDQLAECESGGDWQINSGNGFYGGLQFTLTSWRAVGGTGYPHENSREEQILRAEILQDLQGWGAWPACARRLGLT